MYLAHAIKHSTFGALRNFCVTALIKSSNTHEFSTTVSLKAADVQPFEGMKGILHPSLLEGLDDMGFENMTPVQSAVLSGLRPLNRNCLVRAKAGTGKTMAYLLPAIQTLMQSSPPRGYVSIIILTRTRELALQIAAEATRLLAKYERRVEVHTAVRGMGGQTSVQRFRSGDPKILIGTPHRLHDYLVLPDGGRKFQLLQTLILDEFDALVKVAFTKIIFNILKRLPPKDEQRWQGMCFTATRPYNNNGQRILSQVLGNHEEISTLQSKEPSTLAGVEQSSIIIPSIKHTFQALYSLVDLETRKSDGNLKMIILGNSSAMVALYAKLFQEQTRVKVYEVHSRIRMWNRTQAMTEFNYADRGILFATSVGRGMDIPKVTLVVQVGAPKSSEQYESRIRRTARAGKYVRRAIILLTEWESKNFFGPNSLCPLSSYPGSANILQDKDAASKVSEAMELVDEETRHSAHSSFLRWMQRFQKSWKLHDRILKSMANELALEGMNLPEVPETGANSQELEDSTKVVQLLHSSDMY